MMEISTLVLVGLFIVLYAILFKSKDGKKYPPGPIGLPFVGYLPFMTSKPHLKFTELAKTYGPVYSVQLGSKKVVMICDHQLIKDTFSRDEFFGRPNDSIFELSKETIRTGAFTDLSFKEQRRFSLHMLRDVGFGKTLMEEHIKEEIIELIDYLSGFEGRPLSVASVLTGCMANNISSLLFGRRLRLDDPDRKRLIFHLLEVRTLAGAVSWQQFFPWIRRITTMLNLGQQSQLKSSMGEIQGYCRKQIAEHEKTLDPNNIRDFLDGYLLEIQKRSDLPNTSFHKDVLMDMATAFYGAGAGTVQSTVEWMLLVCAAYPQVQKRVHREIDGVLGSDIFATGLNRVDMPYTEAAICELLRWRSGIPLNLMRRTLKDTELNGYFIPKNTEILAVFWTGDHDERIWGEDVMEYKPERFLSEDGKKLIKPEHYFPFSAGKRSCPGKPFAEIEIFLFFVTLLQNFEVSVPEGNEIDLEGVLGIGLDPKRHDIILKNRHSKISL